MDREESGSAGSFRRERDLARSVSEAARHLVWVEVDLGAVARNYEQLKLILGPGHDLMPVVKSNAYGHGLLPVARTVVDCGARSLGVATLEEALALRHAGLPASVVVLGPVLPERTGEALAHDVTLAVFDVATARAVSDEAVRSGGRVKVHVKIDTGLGRLSVTADQAVPFVQALRDMDGLDLQGIYTHLADAEGIDQSMTVRQYLNFKAVLESLEAAGVHVPMRHVSGSAAGMLMPELRYDYVRAGIALYGLWPSEETRLLMLSRGQDLLHLLSDVEVQMRGVKLLSRILQPALQFKTRIAQVKDVPAGWSIGYGCTYKTRRATRAAVLPLGYAEGLDRHLSNSGHVLVRGQRAPIVGRVCMNMTVVDVTDIPEAATNDEVVIIGTQGEQEITAEEVAEKIGTINYEVVTRIRWDLPRIYTLASEVSARTGSSAT